MAQRVSISFSSDLCYDHTHMHHYVAGEVYAVGGDYMSSELAGYLLACGRVKAEADTAVVSSIVYEKDDSLDVAQGRISLGRK